MIRKLSWTSFSKTLSLLIAFAIAGCAPAQESRTAAPGDQGSVPIAALQANSDLAQQMTATPGGPIITSASSSAYDFVANVCNAMWFSGAGQLPCPGTDGDAKGFVLRMDSPKLETGSADLHPSLLTVPQNIENGYIQGFYPPFSVQYGDRFRAMIGCEGGATGCSVAYRLDYQIGKDPIRTFWGPTPEGYDGQNSSADVDLSPLAGQDVKFILTVLSAGAASGDRALWIGPVIARVGSAAPVTGTPPTATPGSVTGTPTSCDKAEFVADVTIPDGTVLQPGAPFTKTWRLKNVGTCTWTPSYQIVFSTGDQMGSTTAAAFPNNVPPGGTTDLSVNLTAPTAPGKHRSDWILKNSNGSSFGIGANAASPIWVDITVPEPLPPIDDQAVKQAGELAPQFSQVFGIQINPSLAKGLDAARIYGQAGQLAGMVAPVVDENQKYHDRHNLLREVEGIFSINDPRLNLQTMVIISKANIQYPVLPQGAYMLACYVPRPNDCLAVSLRGEEFQVNPQTITSTVIDQVSPPTAAYEEGSIHKCFRILRRKICIRVF